MRLSKIDNHSELDISFGEIIWNATTNEYILYLGKDSSKLYIECFISASAKDIYNEFTDIKLNLGLPIYTIFNRVTNKFFKYEDIIFDISKEYKINLRYLIEQYTTKRLKSVSIVDKETIEKIHKRQAKYYKLINGEDNEK